MVVDMVQAHVFLGREPVPPGRLTLSLSRSRVFFSRSVVSALYPQDRHLDPMWDTSGWLRRVRRAASRKDGSTRDESEGKNWNGGSTVNDELYFSCWSCVAREFTRRAVNHSATRRNSLSPT